MMMMMRMMRRRMTRRRLARRRFFRVVPGGRGLELVADEPARARGDALGAKDETVLGDPRLDVAGLVHVGGETHGGAGADQLVLGDVGGRVVAFGRTRAVRVGGGGARGRRARATRRASSRGGTRARASEERHDVAQRAHHRALLAPRVPSTSARRRRTFFKAFERTLILAITRAEEFDRRSSRTRYGTRDASTIRETEAARVLVRASGGVRGGAAISRAFDLYATRRSGPGKKNFCLASSSTLRKALADTWCRQSGAARSRRTACRRPGVGTRRATSFAVARLVARDPRRSRRASRVVAWTPRR